MLVGLGTILVVAAMVAVKLLSHGGSPTASDGPVPAAVQHALESVPMSEAESVGVGSAGGAVARVDGPVLRGQTGLPRVLYMGAEYCPYCAAVHWPVVVALSRFGRFENLHLSRSATDDIYPGTPTLTFHGSSYHSAYVEFTGVEMQTNVRVNGGYAPLEKPDAVEAALFQKYDAPPYVPPGDTAAIPFTDVANRFIFSGASFSPDMLRGSSWTSIAARLSNPASSEARAIIGTANQLTAAICVATSDTPSSVCHVPVIQLIEHTLRAPAH